MRSVSGSRAQFAVIVCGGLWASLWATAASAQEEYSKITTLVPPTPGHHVGGVAVDGIGNILVADFSETVWKVTPEGAVSDLATGLYGASGNALAPDGSLLQSNFFANNILRISRDGRQDAVITEGLNGPVGLALDPETGDIFATNCGGNTISRWSADQRRNAVFAQSDGFACPNGLAFGGDGALYSVNFRDNRMFRIDDNGEVSEFARVSEAGLGHLVFYNERFYVTAFQSHQIYEVSPDGRVELFAGSGRRGLTDGPLLDADLSFPNGIAVDRYRGLIYINEFLQDTVTLLPRVAAVRVISR